ncbi:Uncharacterised protein [Mycobacteroides abscessus subsp. abscessus]|nr:Uncharacterised protein [Mycobacteroides abscessus subsp. abscessus]
MKKVITALLLLTLIMTGCSETTKEEEVIDKVKEVKDMSKEELNALTKEELNKLNEPANGKLIQVNKTVTLGDFDVEISHYYKLEGIYSKSIYDTTYLLKPTADADDYIVYYVKVTNNSKKESLTPVHFNIITSNGEKRIGTVASDITNPFSNGASIMPGGFKEGNLVGIVPKESKDLMKILVSKIVMKLRV